jgi:cardiolipin synthase A/B
MADEIDRLKGNDKRTRKRPKRDRSPLWPPGASGSEVFLVTRDNRNHRSDIERFYKLALRRAQGEIIIANAYSFPVTV